MTVIPRSLIRRSNARRFRAMASMVMVLSSKFMQLLGATIEEKHDRDRVRIVVFDKWFDSSLPAIDLVQSLFEIPDVYDLAQIRMLSQLDQRQHDESRTHDNTCHVQPEM